MFKKINNTFLIKSNISQKELSECILFITKQSNLSEMQIKKKYNRSKKKFIKFPKNINIKNVDLIIKTKINKDYKYINLKKSLVFYEQKNRPSLSNKKISKYKLKNISFFPLTFATKNIVRQNLCKGTFYIPKKITEFDLPLSLSIAKVINFLSSKNKSQIKINKYFNNFKLLGTSNLPNKKIINILILIIKNFHNEKIITSLTHGDLKCEHLFILNNKLEYLIDWENIGYRSIFFDLFNYFVPWFVHRSYNYFKIKTFILRFIKKYLPNLLSYISDRYDLYFSIFALERYLRIYSRKNLKFDARYQAHQRYNILFKRLINDISNKY